MPFYEYECSSCKHYTEVLQKISDPVLTTCPACGRETLRKLVSAPVFRLKGNGWYETDFKSDKESKRNLATAEKAEAKAESKTEVRPKTETHAETKESKPAASASPASVRPKRKSPSANRAPRPVSKPAVKAKSKVAASSSS